MFRELMGSSRPIMTVLIDSEEFASLSAVAIAALFVMKMRLGPYGIGVLRIEEVGLRLRRVAPDELAKGVAELEAVGFLVIERPVMWIRNGLRFEPSLSIDNPKHRKGVSNHARSLPRLGIANDFVAYYNLISESLGHGAPFEEPFPAIGYGKGIHTHADGLPEQKGKRKERQETMALFGEGDGGAPPGQGVPGEDDAPTEAFLEAWALLLPSRGGATNSRKEAWRNWCRTLRKYARAEGLTEEMLLSATANYIDQMRRLRTYGTAGVQQGATFFGPTKETWREYLKADGSGTEAAGDRPTRAGRYDGVADHGG